MLLLPAFFATFCFMYWSLALACIIHYVKFLTPSRTRDDIFRWSQFVVMWFQASLQKVGEHELHRTEAPIMFIHNHRSWTDFFFDIYITEGRAATLSRWAVFAVFPLFLSSAYVLKSIKFFNRDQVKDKEAFNKWLDKEIAKSSQKGLNVYPEGHRNLLPDPLPLKRGMLKYCHSRKMLLQIVITRGKERLMSEKQLRVGFGVPLVCGFSEVLDPTQFESFDAFWEKFEALWAQMWKDVHAADHKGLPHYEPGKGQDCKSTYSAQEVMMQQAVCTAGVVALVGCTAIALYLAFLSAKTVLISSTICFLSYASLRMCHVKKA